MAKKKIDWMKVLKEAMEAAGTYRASLKPMMYLCAAGFERLERAYADIAEIETLYVESSQGLRPHPACDIAEKTEYRVMRLLDQLGLSIDNVETGGNETLIEALDGLKKGDRKADRILKIKRDRRGETAAD